MVANFEQFRKILQLEVGMMRGGLPKANGLTCFYAFRSKKIWKIDLRVFFYAILH